MNYGVEMDSFAKIYMSILTHIGSGIIKLIRGIHRHRDNMIIS
jgi:hypothetical protein